MFATALTHAASDTDVFSIEPIKVVIEDDKITIVAKAEIYFIALQGLRIQTDKTTFIIKRPKLNFNDPDGTHAEAKKEAAKVLEDAWKMTLDSAKSLQSGNEVGRIGFYEPTVVIDANRVRSVEGDGYLYPMKK